MANFYDRDDDELFAPGWKRGSGDEIEIDLSGPQSLVPESVLRGDPGQAIEAEYEQVRQTPQWRNFAARAGMEIGLDETQLYKTMRTMYKGDDPFFMQSGDEWVPRFGEAKLGGQTIADATMDEISAFIDKTYGRPYMTESLDGEISPAMGAFDWLHASPQRRAVLRRGVARQPTYKEPVGEGEVLLGSAAVKSDAINRIPGVAFDARGQVVIGSGSSKFDKRTKTNISSDLLSFRNLDTVKASVLPQEGRAPDINVVNSAVLLNKGLLPAGQSFYDPDITGPGTRMRGRSILLPQEIVDDPNWRPALEMGQRVELDESGRFDIAPGINARIAAASAFTPQTWGIYDNKLFIQGEAEYEGNLNMKMFGAKTGAAATPQFARQMGLTFEGESAGDIAHLTEMNEPAHMAYAIAAAWDEDRVQRVLGGNRWGPDSARKVWEDVMDQGEIGLMSWSQRMYLGPAGSNEYEPQLQAMLDQNVASIDESTVTTADGSRFGTVKVQGYGYMGPIAQLGKVSWPFRSRRVSFEELHNLDLVDSSRARVLRDYSQRQRAILGNFVGAAAAMEGEAPEYQAVRGSEVLDQWGQLQARARLLAEQDNPLQIENAERYGQDARLMEALGEMTQGAGISVNLEDYGLSGGRLVMPAPQAAMSLLGGGDVEDQHFGMLRMYPRILEQLNQLRINPNDELRQKAQANVNYFIQEQQRIASSPSIKRSYLGYRSPGFGGQIRAHPALAPAETWIPEQQLTGMLKEAWGHPAFDMKRLRDEFDSPAEAARAMLMGETEMIADPTVVRYPQTKTWQTNVPLRPLNIQQLRERLGADISLEEANRLGPRVATPVAQALSGDFDDDPYAIRAGVAWSRGDINEMNKFMLARALSGVGGELDAVIEDVESLPSSAQEAFQRTLNQIAPETLSDLEEQTRLNAEAKAMMGPAYNTFFRTMQTLIQRNQVGMSAEGKSLTRRMAAKVNDQLGGPLYMLAQDMEDLPAAAQDLLSMMTYNADSMGYFNKRLQSPGRLSSVVESSVSGFLELGSELDADPEAFASLFLSPEDEAFEDLAGLFEGSRRENAGDILSLLSDRAGGDFRQIVRNSPWLTAVHAQGFRKAVQENPENLESYTPFQTEMYRIGKAQSDFLRMLSRSRGGRKVSAADFIRNLRERVNLGLTSEREFIDIQDNMIKTGQIPGLEEKVAESTDVPVLKSEISEWMGSVKGFGDTLVENVMSTFGGETGNIITNFPEMLTQVPGIGEARAERLRTAWQDRTRGQMVNSYVTDPESGELVPGLRPSFDRLSSQPLSAAGGGQSGGGQPPSTTVSAPGSPGGGDDDDDGFDDILSFFSPTYPGQGASSQQQFGNPNVGFYATRIPGSQTVSPIKLGNSLVDQSLPPSMQAAHLLNQYNRWRQGAKFNQTKISYDPMTGEPSVRNVSVSSMPEEGAIQQVRALQEQLEAMTTPQQRAAIRDAVLAGDDLPDIENADKALSLMARLSESANSMYFQKVSADNFDKMFADQFGAIANQLPSDQAEYYRDRFNAITGGTLNARRTDLMKMVNSVSSTLGFTPDPEKGQSYTGFAKYLRAFQTRYRTESYLDDLRQQETSHNATRDFIEGMMNNPNFDYGERGLGIIPEAARKGVIGTDMNRLVRMAQGRATQRDITDMVSDFGFTPDQANQFADRQEEIRAQANFKSLSELEEELQTATQQLIESRKNAADKTSDSAETEETLSDVRMSQFRRAFNRTLRTAEQQGMSADLAGTDAFQRANAELARAGNGGVLGALGDSFRKLVSPFSPQRAMMRYAWQFTGGPTFNEYIPAAAQAQGVTAQVAGTMGFEGGSLAGSFRAMRVQQATAQANQIRAGQAGYMAWGGLMGTLRGNERVGGLTTARSVLGPAVGAGLVAGIGAKVLGSTGAIPALAGTALGLGTAGLIGGAVGLLATGIGGWSYASNMADQTTTNDLNTYYDNLNFFEKSAVAAGLTPGPFSQVRAIASGRYGKEMAERMQRAEQIAQTPLGELSYGQRTAALQVYAQELRERIPGMDEFGVEEIMQSMQEFGTFGSAAEWDEGELMQNSRQLLLALRTGQGPSAYDDLRQAYGMPMGSAGDVMSLITQTHGVTSATGVAEFRRGLSQYSPFAQYGLDIESAANAVSRYGAMDSQQQRDLQRLLQGDPGFIANAIQGRSSLPGVFDITGQIGLQTVDPLTRMPLGTQSGTSAVRTLMARDPAILDAAGYGGFELGITYDQGMWGLQDWYQERQYGFQQRQLASRRESLEAQYGSGPGLGGFAGAQLGNQYNRLQLSRVQSMGGTFRGVDFTGSFNFQQQQAEMSYGFAMRRLGLQGAMMAENQRWQDYTSQYQWQGMQIGRERQLIQRDWQEEDLAQRRGQMGWNQQYRLDMMNLSRQTTMLQRQFTEEDWQIQATRSQRDFGWALEDIDENLRFATGRQREQLMTQRERMVVRQNEATGDLERTQDRQEQLWEIEDERYRRQRENLTRSNELEEENFERQLERLRIQQQWEDEDWEREVQHFQESVAHQERLQAMQREQHQISIEQTQANHELQMEQLEERRQAFELNQELQEESLGIQAARMKEAKRRQEEMLELEEERAEVSYKYQKDIRTLNRLMRLITETVGPEMRDLIDDINARIQNLDNINPNPYMR